MRTKLIVLLLLLSNTAVFAKNILIVGDSHSVGPFGHTLFNLIKKTENNVAIYAHASSSSYHWVAKRTYQLTGGAYHAMSVDGKAKSYPFPDDWRIKLATIPFKKIIDDMLYHQDWKKDSKLKADIVVVALGANDYHKVTTASGEFNKIGYKINQEALTTMLLEIESIGATCLWVLPPDGIKKESTRQKLLYQFLKESIQNRCTLIDSMKYRSTGCDGIHFSCSSQSTKARIWANEVMQTLNKFL